MRNSEGDRWGHFGGKISGHLKVREGLFGGQLSTHCVLLLWQQLAGKGEEASGWRGAGERHCGQRHLRDIPRAPVGNTVDTWGAKGGDGIVPLGDAGI